MKRFLTVLGLALAACIGSPVAGAQSCSISNTGNNSNNTCTNNSSTSVTYQCVNGVLINIQTGQAASSGNATSSGNTNGGTATSGNALNNGQTTTNVNSTCAAASTTANPNNPANPNSPSNPNTPSTNSGGQGGAVLGSSIKNLPETGEVTPLHIGLYSGVALAVLAAIAQSSVGIYRRKTIG